MRDATGYVLGKPVPLRLVEIDDAGHELEEATAAAFLEMAEAARADGVTFTVNTAWRDHDHQRRLYDSYMRKLSVWLVRKELPRPPPAAPPGFSTHEAGTTVDVESAGGTNAAFHWLTANGARWGFRRSVKIEPWHWERRAEWVTP